MRRRGGAASATEKLPSIDAGQLFVGEIAMPRLASVLTVAMLAWGSATNTSVATKRGTKRRKKGTFYFPPNGGTPYLAHEGEKAIHELRRFFKRHDINIM